MLCMRRLYLTNRYALEAIHVLFSSFANNVILARSSLYAPYREDSYPRKTLTKSIGLRVLSRKECSSTNGTPVTVGVAETTFPLASNSTLMIKSGSSMSVKVK